MILAALGCQQLNEAQALARQHGKVIFGSMDGSRLYSFLSKMEQQRAVLYFYETG